MAAESQENSSNEESSVDGIKLLKSMTFVLSSLQKNVVSMGSNIIKALNTQKEERKEFVDFVNVLNKLDNTLKKNTRQSEMMDIERHVNDDRHRETMEELENAKADAEKEQPRITQGEPSRKGDGVSTGTRSKRAPINDENPTPTKRGGGRSGGNRGGRSSGGGRGRQSGIDQRGRASGGDHGGRSSGSGHGGRILPPFQNLLTGQDIVDEGMSPTNPQVKKGRTIISFLLSC
ncbi:keratin, type II cytoskeletal 1-like [Impatiens glandulifera]|uniref:keratin, type II cytoskeletal 1-like n=1 Tax=Impatiens glandulifera TaxID=253017 RepID=UPI001FB07F74|nr:keratin, type II cytoskeletal 1-like [Impatiens glandulifera]